MPGAGPRAVAHCEALAREIGRAKLKIKPNCAARTHQNDIRPIAEIVERTGVPIEAATFIGSSPIRRYTEDWTDDFLLRTTENAVKYAVSLGLEVMYVTEDTTRCDPETIKRLYSTAISCGAKAIVICDTVGHATPMGVVALMHFVINEVVKPSGENIRVEWHGHSDRGLAVANSHCGAGGWRRSGARDGHRHRRARRQYPDGPDAGQPEAAGHRALEEPGPDQAERVTATPSRKRPACRFPRTIRWSATTLSAPEPAYTRRRSSRPIARTM